MKTKPEKRTLRHAHTRTPRRAKDLPLGYATRRMERVGRAREPCLLWILIYLSKFFCHLHLPDFDPNDLAYRKYFLFFCKVKITFINAISSFSCKEKRKEHTRRLKLTNCCRRLVLHFTSSPFRYHDSLYSPLMVNGNGYFPACLPVKLHVLLPFSITTLALVFCFASFVLLFTISQKNSLDRRFILLSPQQL